MPERKNGERTPIVGLSAALDERDHSTHEHCDRVTGLSLEIGRQCNLSEHELQLLRSSARLHDIGKIGIPDAVLKKSGALDEDEWAIMKTHSLRSERVVLAAMIEDGPAVALAVRHHHEQFAGGGYPDGIAGEAIPILSRIIAIADTYDAMASVRRYGPRLMHRSIMVELHRVAGTQHDPYLTEKFAAIAERSRFRVAD